MTKIWEQFLLYSRDMNDDVQLSYSMKCDCAWQYAVTATVTSVRLQPATRVKVVTSRIQTESARVSHLLILRIHSHLLAMYYLFSIVQS